MLPKRRFFVRYNVIVAFATKRTNDFGVFMSVRRSLVVLLVLAISLPLAVFNTQSRGNSLNLKNIQLYRVERDNLQSVVTAIGTIESEQIGKLSFVVAGRVAEVLAQPGDYVLAGDVLVRLDDAVQRIAYEQAILAVERAQIQMEDLLAPPDENDLRIAKAAVDSAWGAYLSIQNSVTADDIRAAELAYQQAYQAWQDSIKIRDESPGGTTTNAYTLLDAQVGAASFNAEIARLRMEALKTALGPQLNAAYARVVQAQREYERAQAGPTDFEIDRAEIAIQQAEAQLIRAETAFQRMTLTAPFEGVVSSINIETGSLITPGAPVIELVDSAPLRLTVQVDEIDISLIKEGMSARVQLDALQGVLLPATLERISLLGRSDNGIVIYDVLISLDESDPRVRVGMTAEASLVIDSRQNVLVIPNIYVRLDRQRDRAYVNVLREGGVLEEVEVILGLRGQDSSEVVSGLEEGVLIVIDLSSSTFSIF